MSRDMADNALQQAASVRQRLALIVVSIAASTLVGGAGVLWAHYGTTVFFHAIAAGLAACF